MKEIILKQMMSIIDTNCECKSDFYTYDLRELANENNNTPFIWCVKRGGTKLLQLHYAKMRENLYNEEYRYRFMQNPNADWENFVEICKLHKDDGFIYYYDGITLEQIPFSSVQNIAKSLWQKVLEEMVNLVCKEYPNEEYNKPIEVRWSYKADQVWRNVIIDKNERNSFGCALNGFLKWRTRRAANHEIFICYYNGKDFTFTEFVNEKPILTGGFIYDGRGWRVHT